MPWISGRFIKPGVLTTTMLADLAVTTAKIDNLAVTNAKLGLLSVDTPQIAAGAIENSNAGRLLMETGFFNSIGTVADKFVADIIPETRLTPDTRLRIAEPFADNSLAIPTPQQSKGAIVSTVGNDLEVAPQGAPDLTVQVAVGGVAYNHLGDRFAVPPVAVLGGFTIPAGGGEERRDIVVIDAAGAVVRRVGPEGAPTQAPATLVAGDIPLAEILLTQGVDTDIQAVNIIDLRSTNYIDGSKLIGRSVTANKLDNIVLRWADTVITGGNGVGNVGDLFSSPVSVIPAQGPGSFIIPIGFFLNFGNGLGTAWTAYDAAGAGDDICFRYVGGAEVTTDIDNGNGGGIRLVRVGAGQDYAKVGALATDVIPEEDTAIEMFIRTADPFAAAGDMPIRVVAVYRVVEL